MARRQKTEYARYSEQQHEAYLARRRKALPYLTRLHDQMRETGKTHQALRLEGAIDPGEGDGVT